MKTIETSGQEYFYSIPGLCVPKQKVRCSFIQDIEYIAGWVQKNADDLPFLLEHHIDAFAPQMEMLQNLFNSIYAQWLANDAERIVKIAKTQRGEMCRKLVPPFISKAHTLALDIQMAQKNSGSLENTDNHYDEIESCKDVISGVKVISGLLDESAENPDYTKISDFMSSIPELNDSEYLTRLTESVTSKNTKQMKMIINEITSEYSKKINDINTESATASGMKKLLIVDDMAETLSALTMMLEEHYHVFPLSAGKDALEFIDSGQSPDAFILDIDMPVMDGLTLAKRIRSREHHKNTPILFLTGNSTRATVMKACMYNARAFIVKPANKEILISRLSACLK